MIEPRTGHAARVVRASQLFVPIVSQFNLYTTSFKVHCNIIFPYILMLSSSVADDDKIFLS
jgi:hypothetical protein